MIEPRLSWLDWMVFVIFASAGTVAIMAGVFFEAESYLQIAAKAMMFTAGLMCLWTFLTMLLGHIQKRLEWRRRGGK